VLSCQHFFAAGRWFSLGTPVSSTNKTDCHCLTEVLLKAALSTITLTPNLISTFSAMYYIYASYNIILLCLSEHIETQEFVETAFENTMLMSKV
jgi:hypothetical protein